MVQKRTTRATSSVAGDRLSAERQAESQKRLKSQSGTLSGSKGQDQDESDQNEEDVVDVNRSRRQRESREQSALQRDRVGPDEPEHPLVSQVLAEARAWLQQQQEVQELARIQEIRRRFEAGDPTALHEPHTEATQPTVPKVAPDRANLPRPEPPHKYEKKNRADYNQWCRDNEDYHIKSPTYFAEEGQKVSFGLQYVTETLRSLWETHCVHMRLVDPLWAPTWQELKDKMLGALGTPAERKRAAYEAIKSCKQRSNQSPTELLGYLRPLWAEIQETSLERMTADFTSALSDAIKRDLTYLPQRERETLVQMEEQSNIAYRRLVKEGAAKARSKTTNKRSTPPATTTEGADKAAKKPKTDREGKKTTSKPRNGRFNPKQDIADITCFNCNKKGHYASNCLKPDRRLEKEDTKDKKGKDKGQKD